MAQLRLAGPSPPFLTSCRENDGPCACPGPCPGPWPDPARLACPYMPPPLREPRAARPPLAPLPPPLVLGVPPDRLSPERSAESVLGSCGERLQGKRGQRTRACGGSGKRRSLNSYRMFQCRIHAHSFPPHTFKRQSKAGGEEHPKQAWEQET